jgi:hypothetical protein
LLAEVEVGGEFLAGGSVAVALFGVADAATGIAAVEDVVLAVVACGEGFAEA